MAFLESEIASDQDETALAADPRWSLADRAAHSSAFARASQLRAILIYVVRHAILQPGEPLREYEIACRVLGRRSDFNPIDDNIVRVQMGHLRKKLELYFSGEGRHEETVIELHRGSYTPLFTDRRLASSTTDEPETASEPHRTPPFSSAAEIARAKSLPRWIIATAIVTALLCGLLAGRFLRPADHADKISASAVSNPILRRIFAPNTVVNIVIADTSLAVLQNTTHSDISIADYLDRKYPDNVLNNTQDHVLRDTLTDLTHHRFTSLDDADVVGHCFQWGSILGAKPTVRYSRYMHVRDFEQGNFVIVGSRRGNPWASLFEKDLNFAYEEDLATHTFHFRNRNPRADEAKIYDFATQPDGQTTGYVDIAILPNLTHTGSVLLLNGFSMETNEAAANLIFRSELSPALSRVLAAQSVNSHVEILLRVHNLDGSDNGSDIVAIRTDSSPAPAH